MIVAVEVVFPKSSATSETPEERMTAKSSSRLVALLE
jgi:hypothetical protein